MRALRGSHCFYKPRANPKPFMPARTVGATSPKWQGQCPGCGQWNTLTETVQENRASRFQSLAADGSIRPLHEVDAAELPRTPTGMDELDRVPGGGLVPGGVVLIGGDPGIGKSTLLLYSNDASGADLQDAVRFGRGIAPADSALARTPALDRPHPRLPCSRRSALKKSWPRWSTNARRWR